MGRKALMYVKEYIKNLQFMEVFFFSCKISKVNNLTINKYPFLLFLWDWIIKKICFLFYSSSNRRQIIYALKQFFFSWVHNSLSSAHEMFLVNTIVSHEHMEVCVFLIFVKVFLQNYCMLTRKLSSFIKLFLMCSWEK